MAETDHSIEYVDNIGDVIIDGVKYDALDLTVTSEEKNKVRFMTVVAKNGDRYLFESKKRSFFDGYGNMGDKMDEFIKKLPLLKTASKRAYLRALINKGHIPKMDTPSGILLKKGEYTVFVSNGVSYCQERAKTEYYGGGASIRIAKGVTIRGGKGVPVRSEYFATLDVGTLVLTNKRIIFVGDRKSTTIPISKINALERYSDAFDITKEGVMKQTRFANVDGVIYCDLITKLSQMDELA